MSEHDALLAAIAASPDDDTPRLVYADFIDEHRGEASRANFIRRQCEASRRSSPDVKLYQRVSPLLPWGGSFRDLATLANPWDVRYGKMAELVVVTPRLRGSYRRCVCYHRGFPALVGCTQRDWHRVSTWPEFSQVPIEAVCLYHRSHGCWGVEVPTGDQVSLVNRNIRLKKGELAFPHVRRFLAGCTGSLIDDFLLNRFGVTDSAGPDHRGFA